MVIEYQKILRLSFIFLFYCFLMILFIRSIVFFSRSIYELKNFFHHSDQQAFLPFIKPCISKNMLETQEQGQLYNYRSLGVICEK